jgi:hypothetical protein
VEHDESAQRAWRDRKSAAFAVAEFDQSGIRIQPVDHGADLAAREIAMTIQKGDHIEGAGFRFQRHQSTQQVTRFTLSSRTIHTDLITAVLPCRDIATSAVRRSPNWSLS